MVAIAAAGSPPAGCREFASRVARASGVAWCSDRSRTEARKSKASPQAGSASSSARTAARVAPGFRQKPSSVANTRRVRRITRSFRGHDTAKSEKYISASG